MKPHKWDALAELERTWPPWLSGHLAALMCIVIDSAKEPPEGAAESTNDVFSRDIQLLTRPDCIERVQATVRDTVFGPFWATPYDHLHGAQGLAPHVKERVKKMVDYLHACLQLLLARIPRERGVTEDMPRWMPRRPPENLSSFFVAEGLHQNGNVLKHWCESCQPYVVLAWQAMRDAYSPASIFLPISTDGRGVHTTRDMLAASLAARGMRVQWFDNTEDLPRMLQTEDKMHPLCFPVAWSKQCISDSTLSCQGLQIVKLEWDA